MWKSLKRRCPKGGGTSLKPAVGNGLTLGFVFLTALAMYGCSSGALGAGSAIAPADLDLSGSWILNETESDNPQQMMQQGGRGGGGMGGRGGRRGGAPSQVDQQRMMQTMRIATQPPRRLVLDQQDSTVTLRNPNGRTLMLRTDWKKVGQEIENGGQVDIRARWRGGELQIERDVHLGGKITQKYSLSSDGDRLLVETRLEMGRASQPRVFRYVYDSVPRLP